jgi:tRNA threonylcarbamoyladenosine biosynthesis protein TsaE
MNSTSHQEHKSATEKETKGIAKQFAKKCKVPAVILLQGELGAGKTTFVRGFAEELGISENIASPSYTYLRTYQIPDEEVTLYHFDLYLLSEKKGDISSLFLDEALEDPNGIGIIEWAEYLPESFSVPHVGVKIQVNEEMRKIIID